MNTTSPQYLIIFMLPSVTLTFANLTRNPLKYQNQLHTLSMTKKKFNKKKLMMALADFNLFADKTVSSPRQRSTTRTII